MPEIIKIQTKDILRKLPDLIPWNTQNIKHNNIDVLICCAGFEDRAKAISEELSHIHINTLIVIQYPTNLEENRESLASFKNLSFDSIHEIKYERNNFYQQVVHKLSSIPTKEDCQIVVDISAMASYIVYRVLNAIWENNAFANFAIFYAEAAEYSPTKVEWDEFFSNITHPEDNLSMAESYEQNQLLTKGIDEIYECDVFPGKNIGSLATDIIAIPSFSLPRMKSSITYIKTQYNVPKDNTRWFLGLPPNHPKNGWRYDALAHLYNVKTNGIAISTRDYTDVFIKLNDVWDEVNCDRHLVIAGLSSKMQHLGTFLFLRIHPECGLVHCEPNEFIAKEYSTGIGPMWWVDFGNIKAINELLKSYGTLEFIW